LPSVLSQSYRNALLRATIALAVAFALVPRGAAAAGPSAASPSEPAEETAGSGGGVRTSPSRAVGAGPLASPFSDEALGARDEGGDAEGDDAGATDDEDEAPGAPLRALSCLEGEGGNDNDGARRGVQKRDFLKKRRFEISALGGNYASDAVSSTYVYGGAVSFFPSEDFGVELFLGRHRVAFRLEEPFTSFDRERHFVASTAWEVMGAMLWSPIHAKLRWTEKRITHLDLLLVAGGGQTVSDTAQGFTFQAGVGLKIYLARFVSLRADVRDFMVPEEVLGRGRTTHNLVTMFGVSGWLPG